ncbi:ladderlectin-like [Archocentrus centrarchus]|uniref:ladderlectin-like n=1 Tax=Archocentrus centrarchus TaxID=63155 RepID=UPI0011EA4F28|nr:ladderlectin-like [Archocentrus centrarchus]
MNMLTVCALVCTIVALAGSAAQAHLVKRSLRCGGGWLEFNRHCFYYIAKPMPWARAEKNCISLGGHLASVHNFSEYHEIQRLILSGSHEYKETWIGGTDAQEDSYWFWSDGSTFPYTDWCPGEPNNHKGPQQCLKVNHGAGKCWDDVGCHIKRPSVCAKNM